MASDDRTARVLHTTGRQMAVLVCAALLWAVAGGQDDPSTNKAILAPGGGLQIAGADSNVDRLLDDVAEYMQNERFADAAQILQLVLDDHGAALTYRPDGVFRQGRRVAYETIAGWAKSAPEALRTYRLSADAALVGLIGSDPAACPDERKLREAVNKYLLSNSGDECVLALGGLLIDRGEFAKAVEVLSLVVGRTAVYPDPSVDLREVWVRFGLAAARAGDHQRARTAVAALKQAEAQAWRVELIQRHLTVRGEAEPATGELFGRGPMPNIEARPGRGDDDAQGWGLLWEARSGRSFAELAGALLASSPAPPRGRTQMVERWRARPWRPATMARVVGDRLLFRAGLELVSVNRNTGRRQWTSQIAPKRGGEAPSEVQRGGGFSARPQGHGEILMFGDRLSQRFTVSADGKRAYVIHPSAFEGSFIGVGRIRDMGSYVAGPNLILPGNELVAIDLATGRKVWQRTIPSDKPWWVPKGLDKRPTQFFAAPLVLGDRLYTIVDDSLEISLTTLDARDGKVLWRQRLGEITSAGDLSPEAPIIPAIDAWNVYVSTGRGAVVAADVYTGSVRWVLPYARQQIDPTIERCSVQPAWAENTVTIVGKTLVVTAADDEALMFVDRQTGRKVAEFAGEAGGPSSDQMDYVIGAMDGRIYIGGPNEVHCFKVDGAKHLWTASWRQWLNDIASTGRAVLTRDAIFVPVDRQIVHLDPATGEHLGKPVAAIGLGGEPIGNLLSDGEQLVDVAMDRARAMVDLPTLLDGLDQRIAEGDVEAFRRRAETWDQLDKPYKALADQRAAIEAMSEGPERAALREQLFMGLLQQVRRAPKAEDAGQLLEEAAQLAGRPEQEMLGQLVRADWLAASDRRAEAVERYRQIALEGDETLISPEADWPGWHTAAATLAADRLGNLVNGEGGAALIESLDAAGKTEMAKLGETPAISDLARIAQAHPGTSAAQDAIARIAAIGTESGDKRFAPAELALRQLAGAGVGPNAEAARDELAAMYMARGWAREAATVLDPHRQRFVTGPATEGAEAGKADDAAPNPLARRIAAALKADERRDGERLADPPLQRLTVAETNEVQPLQLTCGAALNHSPFLRDHLFVHMHRLQRNAQKEQRITREEKHIFRKDQRLARLNPRQQFKTEATLDLPDDATRLFERWFGKLCGGLDGHVMVLLTPGRMVAWDVMAGRTLWEVAPPSGQRQIIVSHPGRRGRPTGYVEQARQPTDSHDVHGGMVVELLAVPDSFEREVVARELLTGRVLWRHWSEDKVFHGVHLFGRHAVITAGAQGERLLVLDRRTGQPLRQHALSELFSAASFFPGPHGLVYHQTVWNAPSKEGGRGSGRIEFGLVPFDDKAQPWKRTLSSRSRIHAVDTRYALVLPDDDEFITELVDLRTGKTLWNIKDKNISRYLGHHDLGPQTDRLVLLTSKRGRRAGYLLQEVNLTTGEPIRQISFSYRHYGYYNMRAIARSGPYIALTGLDNSRLPANLRFFRRADGKPAKIEVRGSLSVGRPQLPCIRGGALIVPHSQGIIAYVPDGEAEAVDEQ